VILRLNHKDPDIANEINKLQKESYFVEAELIKYPGHPNLKQGLSEIQSSQEIFLGYFADNMLVGAISYESEDINSITICRLIVKPYYFGKGIAGKLIETVEKNLQDIRIIYVQTARDNLPAINRYQKSGYRLVDEYYTHDGLALVKLRKDI
jgi:ribosomal protein S18 acetylase RimI-like enzyme